MNYLKIEKENVCNGDGLRVVLWLSGCSHHCFNCQNPQTWSPDNGIKFDDTAIEEIFSELSKDYISGITFSGGDPLHENNISEVTILIKQIKERFPTKTIWLYTGYKWENLINRIDIDFISNINVLIDGEYEDSNRNITLKWRGSSNQRVIDVKKSLQEQVAILYCE